MKALRSRSAFRMPAGVTTMYVSADMGDGE
jgi:hypothetical protein